MNKLANIFKALLNHKFKDYFKQNGYKQKGNNFVLETDSMVIVIIFQNSQFNVDDYGSFTINIDIYSKFQDEFVYRNSNELIKSGYRVSKRIGELLDNPSDIWWDYRSTTTISTLSDEVFGIFLKFAEPTIKKYISFVGVLELLEEDCHKSFLKAALNIALNDKFDKENKFRVVYKKYKEDRFYGPIIDEFISNNK